MARRSLRTKLTVAVIVAVLPALALSAWQAVDRQRAADLRKSEAVAATAELAAARYRTLIEGSRRLLEAVCAEDAVRQSANPDASPTEINRCEAYLTNVLGKFPREYSSALVTDAEGVARCATQPTALGVGFTDREVFRLVRDTKAFTIGAQVASRVAPRTVIPVALPILQDGAFRGMCAVGISLTTIGDLVTPVRAAEHVAVALVDRNGGSIGGDPLATRALPVPARVAAAIVGGQTAFSDYGQDGSLYEFHLLPLASNSIFVVSVAGVADGLPGLVDSWGGFAAVVLALAGALLAVWLGADRWCVRPLRYIQNFADRVARGEDIELARQGSWAPELASVSDGVRAMAEAIASREAELRAGLEQRDHMLREIHHRVKNNLQTVAALLRLQARRTNNAEGREALIESVRRVSSIALVHDALSMSVDEEVNLDAVVDRILPIMNDVATVDTPIRINRVGALGVLDADRATALIMVITELVQNAIEHAFDTTTQQGCVTIRAERSARWLDVVVHDDGRGLPDGFSLEKSDRLGLQIVRTLVSAELDGSLGMHDVPSGGTNVVLRVPIGRKARLAQ